MFIFFKLPYFNSDMLSVHHSYATNRNSIKPLHSNNICYAPCSTLWSVDAQPSLLAHSSQNKAIVVTMATKCNSHQQYSVEFQQLYHGLYPFLYKTSDYIWQERSNQHPQSTATPSRSYLEYRKNYNSYRRAQLLMLH